ncbi:hypothetical protein Patl1_37224 [Pistacia atlantica]|nr:hypothetical protein Patl1_37224 [Pistacia atlantica]
MLPRGIGSLVNLHDLIMQNSNANIIVINKLKHPCGMYSTGSIHPEFPRKLKKNERKPLVTSINELKRLARWEKKQRQMVKEKILRPPENGLLIKELIPIAHEVYASRTELFACVSVVVESISIYTCSLCGEVHVGHPPHKIRTCNVAGSPANKEHTWSIGDMKHVLPLVESFLYDSVGRAVSHNERLEVDRIPAVVELCIQAGIDIPEYPTRRRVFPAYNIAGKIIDLEKRFPKEVAPGKGMDTCAFWGKRKKSSEENKLMDILSDDTQGVGERAVRSASKLMHKYAVQTCGYCSEVQVGPKGHRVRNCQAYKHQMRDGQHAWQEATVEDLVPPVYVWHVQDLKSGKKLVNDLKRYYGILPAVVELFAQAGANITDDYAGIMREDVAVPELDEENWVV